ncbi:class I peptide chain release factor [Treponema primitia ZAS-2]|uniref:Class I peptide chain release factor n=1 Tax=Treponema primitia (strain ATCC BAA-887 / DSM 12427 / ZAS-2) TaxID=545694 RepID=F5YHP6_TREPZ|nr:alternative ribosome rescue aminoacyl-tRNA hydrolase ArfB [Treponema primitia]AEF87028.1 class I peptide chain release factor [Treponema primitia ZAS-2]
MNQSILRQTIRLAAQASFSRSGGPGGQNVNKVNTKVTLRLALRDLAGISEPELNRLRETLGSRISAGDGGEEIVIAASEERSQHTNLERAYARLEMLVTNGAQLPKRRRPTKPTRASREQRLQSKHLHGQKKQERQTPGME